MYILIEGSNIELMQTLFSKGYYYAINSALLYKSDVIVSCCRQAGIAPRSLNASHVTWYRSIIRPTFPFPWRNEYFLCSLQNIEWRSTNVSGFKSCTLIPCLYIYHFEYVSVQSTLLSYRSIFPAASVCLYVRMLAINAKDNERFSSRVIHVEGLVRCIIRAKASYWINTWRHITPKHITLLLKQSCRKKSVRYLLVFFNSNINSVKGI